jgi:molecular chaperone DnaK
VIHFDLDLSGMLKVTATEKVTGLAKSVTLDTKGQHSLNIEAARRNIAALVGEPSAETTAPAPAGASGANGEEEDGTAEPEELLNTAKDLRKRSETLLQKTISPGDATEIRELIHQSAVAIKDGDWDALDGKNEALSDLLFYLED